MLSDCMRKADLRIVDEDQVCIPVEEYAELVRKADRLEMLAADIRRRIAAGVYGQVDDDLVRVLTGTMGWKPPRNTEHEEDDGK